MPSDASFRLSLYLTLAFACAAVGYAESPLLFEAPVVASVVVVSLAVLYRLETRVELLTIPAANRLGLMLGLANLVWAVFRVLREMNDPQMPRTDWPVLGLALTGPFVMTLMPAKLARREKHAGDYWWLHGLALAAAALAGALADDVLAVVLIAAYAACAVWNLSAFALLRAGGAVRPIPGQAEEVRVAGVVTRGTARTGLALAAGLAAAAAAAAAPLYLLTPRSGFEKLEFGKPRVEIGFAADQMVDLNQTGHLRPNEQIAFEVAAEAPSGEKVALPGDLRWRGQVRGRYQAGKWPEATDLKLPAVVPAPRPRAGDGVPLLWRNQVAFTFTLPRGSRDRFLADPVTWVGDREPPVLSVTPGGYRPWVWAGNGGFITDTRPGPSGPPVRYVQVWRRESDPDLSPPLRLVDFDRERVLRQLRHNPVPRVKDYADQVVGRMVREGLLPADHQDRATMLPRPEFHDLVARHLAHHLATTPEFGYTTELRRARKDLDPVEDFLFHTRAGHCERFASALVLMLRSQGIPAVLVLGFKGCEPTDEPGRYVVRQEHAHAWVDALIEDHRPRPWWQVWKVSRWRSLDPTPAGDFASSGAGGSWAERTSSWLRRAYATYIVDFTPEERARALASLAAAATRPDVLGAIAAAAGLVVLARRVSRRRAARPRTAEGQWFDRLAALLAGHGYAARPGETAREFAARVGDDLRSSPATTAVAEVPLDWAEAYYESRFGGRAPDPPRLAALDARLEELRAALAARPARKEAPA
jgi:hypothetical protein